MGTGCEQVDFRQRLGAVLDLLNGECRVGECTDPRVCEPQVPATTLRVRRESVRHPRRRQTNRQRPTIAVR